MLRAHPNILITGAAGFIGQYAVREAVRQGWNVYALDINELSHLPVRRWFKEDIALCNPEAWGVAIDCCIHLAWPLPPQDYADSQENFVALRSSAKFLEQLARIGCKHFVVAGSCAEYSSEQNQWPVREVGHIAPNTSYGLCKDTLHKYCLLLAEKKTIRCSWGRIFQLYGEGEPAGRLLPSLARAWLLGQPFQAGACTHVRDYLHVQEVANALVHLAKHGKHGAYNVCSGEGIPLKEFMMRFAGSFPHFAEIAFGAKAEGKGWNPPQMWGDNRKLRELGWVQRVNRHDALALYASSFEKKPYEGC